MSNLFQARVILRHGDKEDYDPNNFETAELVFAEDDGILYIKKKDGTVLEIGPAIENPDNKKAFISEQPQNGDSDTYYPTVGAVRNFVKDSQEVETLYDGLAYYNENASANNNHLLLFFGSVSETSGNISLGLPELKSEDYGTVFHFDITFNEAAHIGSNGVRFYEQDSNSITEITSLRHPNIVKDETISFDYTMSSSNVRMLRMRIYELAGKQEIRVKITKRVLIKDYAYSKAQTNNLLDTKAESADTLEGYGIEDAYTKEETNNLLNTKAESADTLEGYGIEDAYTKEEANNLLKTKAESADTLEGYGIEDGCSKTQAYALQKGILYPLPPANGIAHERNNSAKQINTILVFFGSVGPSSNNNDLGLPKLTSDDYGTVFHFEITFEKAKMTSSGVRFWEVDSSNNANEITSLRHTPVIEGETIKFDYSMSSTDIEVFRMRMYEDVGEQKIKVKVTKDVNITEYSYGKSEVDALLNTLPNYLEAEIERVKTAVLTAANYNDVVFGLYTDIHFGNANEDPLSLAQKWNEIRSLRRLADENILDFVIQGGDLLSQGLYDYDTKVLNRSQTEFSGCRVPLYTSKGDHDSNQTDIKISKSDFVKRTAPFMPKAVRSSAYPNNYYFDLPEKKTRVINIDTGTVMVGQSSYGEDYKTWSNEALYDWLLDEVLTDEVKSGWKFIIFTHAPCDYEWQFGNAKRYRNAHPEDTTSSQNSAKGNMLLINDLMAAINNATTFSTEKEARKYELTHNSKGVVDSATFVSKETVLSGNVYGITGLFRQVAGYPQYIRTKDFSGWTSKAKMILSGHCHCDRLNTTTLVPNGNNYVRGNTSYAIAYTGSAARTGYKDEQDYYYPCFGTDGEIASWGHITTNNRALGTVNEQLFDIWIVGDTYVKRVRFGAGANSPLLSTTVTLDGSPSSDSTNYREQQFNYLAEKTIDKLSKSYVYTAEIDLTEIDLFDNEGRLSHFAFSNLTYKKLIDNFSNIRLILHIPDNPYIGEISVEVRLLNYIAAAGGGSVPESTNICALVHLVTVPELNSFLGTYYANYQKSNENDNVLFSLGTIIKEDSIS